MSIKKLRKQRITKCRKITSMLAALTPIQIMEMIVTDAINYCQAISPTELTPLELEKNTLKILKKIEWSIGNKLKDDVLCSGNNVEGFETSTQSKMLN